MSKEILPLWNLESIYKDHEAFLSSLSSVPVLAQEAKVAINAKKPLYEVLKKLSRLSAEAQTLSAYANMRLTTDTTNSLFIKDVNAAEEASIIAEECFTLFKSKIESYEGEFSDPRLSIYAYFFEKMRVEAEHSMSTAEEALAAALAPTGADAFTRLFDSLLASSSDGDKTLIELRNDATNPDREIRRTSYEREKALLKRNEVSAAAALNAVKGAVLTLEAKRGWKSPLEHSLFLSGITQKAHDALLSTLEESIPLFKKYFAIKAKALGLEKLSWYDIEAPIGSFRRKYTFKEAQEVVISCYSSFSEDMGAFARKAFKEGWIDAAVHPGKTSGAYCEQVVKVKESRVFLSFDGTYSSLSTLAHELGHAYHGSLILQGDPLLTDYPMTLAETASLFAEHILYKETLKTAGEEETLMLLDQFIGNAAQVCLDILSRYYFEKSVFEERAHGELSPSEFCALMSAAQERTYGESVENLHEYMWAVKGHYYSQYLSFYNYPYAFGELFALALFSRSENDPAFPSKWRELLSLTVKQNAVAVARSIGADIEDKAFWNEGMALVKEAISNLEAICD